ncbi:pilus assembly protein [Anaeromyxobacter paludicola]|uniref:Tfp pilus assembly protein tip-associated adhesin PilY1-like protein n=1 Tax=Anaeromyxobacter paludicola TaxID=2918171 RepID=A0ABM7XB80_9BACT|nr:PilC/PilY family type IV pilus protein [Anaeromyxobacter paludicola]BDG09096.1 hypothetical protein AMPC_22090 [Anaeromyxobacter paludicola]
MRISSRPLRNLAFLLACCLAPFASDAVNDVACCNLAASFGTSIFQGGNGDEDFFSVPGGSANLMILLDNSSSMLDFPNPLPFPSSWPTSTRGVCSGTALDAYTGLRTQTPYDNGATNGSGNYPLADNPPWSLANCKAASTDGGTGTCLFNGASYYRYLSGSDGIGTPAQAWNTSTATEYKKASTACAHAQSPGECAACLDGAGYYLYWNAAYGSNDAAFRGDFVNAYPPKFVIARKVVKNLAMFDDNNPSQLDTLRIGLTIFNPNNALSKTVGTSLGSYDGGQLVVPLGPSCDAYPAQYADMQAPRQVLINAINDPTKVMFYNAGTNGIGTPLAEALFNVGQYFSTSGATGPYQTLFGSSWVNPSFDESASGTVGASAATWTGSRTNQHSICWSCQQSSVVIITDGEPMGDDNLPSSSASSAHSAFSVNGKGDFRKWDYTALRCDHDCGTDLSNGAPNLLHKVAAFLYQTDLRSDAEAMTLNGVSVGAQTGQQNVDTYTISFGISGTPATSPAIDLLTSAADATHGHGFFSNTSNDAELEQALADAAGDIVARATSFSVSNTTPLQTSQNAQLFLARFRPSTAADWEGHLYRFRLWNEVAEGCDAGKSTAAQTPAACVTAGGGTKLLNPNLNGDEAGGKAICGAVFILDGDCDPVLEDASGEFMKSSFLGSQLVAGTTPARPVWDAGRMLSDPVAAAAAPRDPDGGTPYRSARWGASSADRRRIYTVTDSDGDGLLTAADQLIELDEDHVATLLPLLALDAGYCTTLYKRMGVLGLPGWSATDLTQCAKQVVNFVRGWDVLDEDGDNCGGPGFPGNDTSCPSTSAPGTGAYAGHKLGAERDRTADARSTPQFWKLGDVFHSSPAVVNPPASELLCDLGLDNQCLATLHSPKSLTTEVQTPADWDVNGNGRIDPGEDAFEQYRRDNSRRVRLVLVGANDGMLHAFDGGSPDLSRAPDWLGNYPYTDGSGAELWAFVPPDLLPKLKNALLSHDYFVDGNTMVRDVWVDGTSGGAKDGRKQPGEFHTLAVLSERAGGSEYVALDVTSPRSPRFLWMYPQPCTIDVSMMGQSWSGFAPRPPPIGPVKLAVAKKGPQDPTGRGFEERWIVMLNGGYDPSLTKGRGVWMIDAWTGQLVWKFTNDELQANVNSSGGMWPVPGGVALLDIGAASQARVDSDGFFDTATWGDVGGQLYVARFQSPGVLSNGVVGNWTAARAFEEQRQGNDAQNVAGRSEFYYMPANTVDPATGFLHSYLGSGNRERMLQVGAGCGPDDVFGCFQGGCNTDVSTDYDYGSCTVSVKAHSNNGVIKQDRSSSTCPTSGPVSCDQLSVKVKLQTVCNGWKPSGGGVGASMSCDAHGACGSVVKVRKGNDVPTKKLAASTTHSRFYGIWSYGGARSFDGGTGATAAWTSAVTFDRNRLTDVAYGGTCLGTAGGTCSLVDATYASVSSAGAVTCGAAGPASCTAGSYDAGWMYEYGRVAACQLQGGCADTKDWLDEKTGSGATVLAGCVNWNSFRPMGSAISSTSPCQTNAGTPRNYTYLSDYLTGAPSTTCGQVGASAITRASTRPTIAPPLDPTQMVALGANRQVTYSTAQIEPGSPPQSQQVGTTSELGQTIYWLEVPRELHACRHADASQCE